MTITNGEVPLTRLVEVETGLFLETQTAAAYRAMKAAAAADAVTLAIPRPAGAYRSLLVQQDMHDRPWLYNLDPNSSVPIAPAGSSTHGLGDRVDIVRGSAGDWAIANASRFGFVREFGAADPRHFRYLHPTWASVNLLPIESEEDDDMPAPRIRQAHWDRPDGKRERLLYSFDNGLAHRWVESGAALANQYASDYDTGSSQPVTESMFREIQRACTALAGSITVNQGTTGTTDLSAFPEAVAAAVKAITPTTITATLS